MKHAVVLYEPPGDALTAQRPAAVKTVGEIIARSTAGQLSSGRAKRLGTTFRHVEGLSASLTRIARDCNQMTADAAACARTVAQCEADIAASHAAAATSDAARAEAEALAAHLPDVLQHELAVRSLVAQVQAAELQQRLDALRPPSASAAPHSTPDTSSTSLRITSDEALLARLSSEADAILREVQGGLVPTDARHPYHAFAGCVYLRAKLDGQDATAAAAQADGELVAHMRDDREFTPGERKAFRREYDDLKKRLDDRTETRQGAALLSMMKHVGAASGPANNGRGVQ